jgi:serine/threonine protein kinase
MGSVWLGHHKALDTEVVIKFLATALIEDEEIRERFQREAAAAARVRSPHVVQTLDHGMTDDGWPFIVMEYLEGQDMGQVLRQRRLAMEQVASVVEQVARALNAAHRHNVIHRDVKPANIFFINVGAREPFVKLLDFGVAKTEHGMTLTSTGQLLGTPVYMSPEQIAGQELDHRSDVWSLGVVAFRALTGERPFTGDTVATVAYKVVHAPMPKPSDFDDRLPRSVDAWFERACARDVAQRFNSARELADALWEAIGHPQAASSWSGETQTPTNISQATTVVESRRAQAPEPTGGSLKVSVATVTPPPKRRGLTMVGLGLVVPLAIALGYLLLNGGSTPATPSNAGSASAVAPIEVLETSVPASSDEPPVAAEAAAAASAAASASATTSASSKPVSRPPRRIRRRPTRPANPDEDDLGF